MCGALTYHPARLSGGTGRTGRGGARAGAGQPGAGPPRRPGERPLRDRDLREIDRPPGLSYPEPALCSRVVRHDQAAQLAEPCSGRPRPILRARQVQLLLVSRGGCVVHSARPLILSVSGAHYT